MNDYRQECFFYCRKHGTLECPNSSKCLAHESRPYFELDPRKIGLMERLKMGIIRVGKGECDGWRGPVTEDRRGGRCAAGVPRAAPAKAAAAGGPAPGGTGDGAAPGRGPAEYKS